MDSYTDHDARRDAMMPTGFAPEDAMPDEIRRTQRLRSREVGYGLAESLLTHGAPVEVAALLIAVPRQEPPARQWTVRVEDAELCGDRRVCSMPVRGCRTHGDTLAWRAGEWRCRVPKCRGHRVPKQQRRHCDEPATAVIDYPSGHQRRVCRGHLASEQAVWADTAADTPTIRVTPLPDAGPADTDAAWAGRPRLTLLDGGR